MGTTKFRRDAIFWGGGGGGGGGGYRIFGGSTSTTRSECALEQPSQENQRETFLKPELFHNNRLLYLLV